jgi:hypothetical protein
MVSVSAYVIFIVRTAVTVKVTVFCGVIPCNLDTDVSEERAASIYKIKEYSLPEYISQKTELWLIPWS